MRLSNIKKYIKDNKLERVYNQSFNRNRINDPKKTFYSSYEVDCFVSQNKEINYLNYYYYLSLKICKGKRPFVDYLKNIATKWCNVDKNINHSDAVVYLLKQFVINPVDGKLKEERVLENIKNHFADFNIMKPTREEDAKECWDIGIEKNGIKIYFQVKPESFFNSLSTTSKFSIEKISKASKDYNKPIFLIKELYGNIMVMIRDVNTIDGTKFLKINDFKAERLTQEQINNLSKETYRRLKK